MGGNEAETPGGRNQNQNLSPRKDFHTNKENSLNYIFTVHFVILETYKMVTCVEFITEVRLMP